MLKGFSFNQTLITFGSIIERFSFFLRKFMVERINSFRKSGNQRINQSKGIEFISFSLFLFRFHFFFLLLLLLLYYYCCYCFFFKYINQTWQFSERCRPIRDSRVSFYFFFLSKRYEHRKSFELSFSSCYMRKRGKVIKSSFSFFFFMTIECVHFYWLFFYIFLLLFDVTTCTPPPSFKKYPS